MQQNFSQDDGMTTTGIGASDNQNFQNVLNISKDKNNPALNLLIEHENAINTIKNEANKKIAELQKTAKDKSGELQKQVTDFESKLNSYKDDLVKVNNWMVGVVIGISVAFVLAMFAAYWGVITDKEIYLKYNDMYKNYSDQNSSLKDIVSQQKIENNDLKNEVDMIKAKNNLK